MKSIYKPMKIQALIVAVIASFIVYGCEDNETNCLDSPNRHSAMSMATEPH